MAECHVTESQLLDVLPQVRISLNQQLLHHLCNSEIENKTDENYHYHDLKVLLDAVRYMYTYIVTLVGFAFSCILP